MANVVDPMMTPGQRIRFFRERVPGLTQARAAQLKGVTVSAWRKWESGERQVLSIIDLIDIARIVRVKDLFALTGLPVGHLPDEPSESPYLPAVRTALLAPPNQTADVDPHRLASSVEFAYETWHTSAENHQRLGVMLPELITLVRAADRSPATAASSRAIVADAAVRLWMLLRSWAKWVGAHEVSLLAAQRGVDAAVDANPAAEAAAAWSAAMALSTRGLAEESAEMAVAAARTLEARGGLAGDSLAMLGALHLLSAIEFSRLDDQHRTASAMTEGARIAAVTGECNAYRTTFGPTNVQIYAATLELDRARADSAVRLASAIEYGGMPSMERRYAVLLVLARAHALRGDDLAAAVCLRRAAGEYPQAARTAPVFRAVVRQLLVRETPSTREELRPLATLIGLA